MVFIPASCQSSRSFLPGKRAIPLRLFPRTVTLGYRTLGLLRPSQRQCLHHPVSIREAVSQHRCLDHLGACSRCQEGRNCKRGSALLSLLIPKPPSLMGSDAWVHWSSVVSMLRMELSPLRSKTSYLSNSGLSTDGKHLSV